VSKFSLQGDYFISGGTDKAIYVWKTGFFDSFTEKIVGEELLLEKYK
jgi:hypothetical protein